MYLPWGVINNMFALEFLHEQSVWTFCYSVYVFYKACLSANKIHNLISTGATDLG